MIAAIVTLSLISIASILLNVWIFKYASSVAKQLKHVSENFKEFGETVSVNFEELHKLLVKFTDYVESMHVSPVFYGEPSVQALVENSKAVVKDVEEFIKLTLSDIDGTSEDEEKDGKD